LDGLQQSGAYALGASPNDVHRFAVNVDPRESDLRHFMPADLASTILGGVGFEVLGAAGRSEAADTVARTTDTRTTVTRAPAGQSRWLLVAVLTLLLVEQVMAWNGRYGLFALMASPIIVTGIVLLPNGLVVLLVLITAGFCAWRWRLQSESRVG